MGTGARIGAAGTAIASAALAFTLAAHHPLNAGLATAAIALWIAIAAMLPNAWLFAIPALLPVLALAPWSGSLFVDEFDLLVLGAAAAGFGRFAVEGAIARAAAKLARSPSGSFAARAHGCFALLLLVSILVSAARGLADAGGLRFDALLLYEDPLNSLRIAKPYAFALLLLPLTFIRLRRSPGRATAAFAAGMVTGLAMAALGVVWERVAFPGLLDFSSDYRVTGTFWEMHVGGAALDGFLALAAPFAVHALLRARSSRGIAVAGAPSGAAVYAALVTFSRGLYVALAVAVPLQAALVAWQRRRREHGAAAYGARAAWAVLAVAAAAFAFDAVFTHGGYRTLAALLGVLAASFVVSKVVRASPPRYLGYGIVAGALAAGACAWLGPRFFKGPYVLYALALVVCLAAAVRPRPSTLRATVVVAAYVCAAASVSLVARFWGGPAAFGDAGAVVLALLAITAVAGRAHVRLFPEAARSQVIALGVAAVLAGCVAVVSGGARMESRFSTSEQDFDDRLAHWHAGLSILEGRSDWLLGKGLGRFPAAYRQRATQSHYPGRLALTRAGEESFVTMAAPGHMLGGGELLRMSQRVTVSGGVYLVSFDARSREDVSFAVEICEKHLLYVEEGHCAEAAVPLKAGDGLAWTHLAVVLDGRRLTRGNWFAPRLAFFSIALGSGLRTADIDNVSVVDAHGVELIDNGSFVDGLTRWFFTSDKYHLPWHMKNLALAVLFDQGLLGLIALGSLIAASVALLVRTSRRGNALAPALLAALAGFLLVGLFDSLLDVPRVAFLFYFLVLAGPALAMAEAQGPETEANIRSASRAATA
jgi:hypothetical protein